MNIRKAVITAAGRQQRTLPLQTVIDRDGMEKSVLQILVEETVRAGVEDVGIVIRPGDEKAYAAVAGSHAGRLTFIPQAEPRGYGHAIFCARDFVGDDSFLHLVGDHLYVSHEVQGCAAHLVAVAKAEDCAVSAVQATRESQLPYYGAIGGTRLHGKEDLYRITAVLEKPTPTLAEQEIIVPGLRAGHYLCFFGMHLLTSGVMTILEAELGSGNNSVSLSAALAQLALQEKYLALQKQDKRYDLGNKYGLLEAQLALALSGQERDEVLTKLVTLLAEQ